MHRTRPQLSWARTPKSQGSGGPFHTREDSSFPPSFMASTATMSPDALCDTLRALTAQALQQGGHRLIDAITKDLRNMVGQFLQSQESIPTPSMLHSSTSDEPLASATTLQKKHQFPQRALSKVLRRKLLVDVDTLRAAYASSRGGMVGSSSGVPFSDPSTVLSARVPGLSSHTGLVRELQLQALLHFSLGTMGLMHAKQDASSSSPLSCSSSTLSLSPSLLRRVHRFLADLQLRQTFSLGTGGTRELQRDEDGSLLQRASNVVTISQSSGSSMMGSTGVGEEEDAPAVYDKQGEKTGEKEEGREGGNENDTEATTLGRHSSHPTHLLDTSFDRFLATAFLAPFRASHPQALLALYTALECEELLPADLLAAGAAADGPNKGPLDDILLLEDRDQTAISKRRPVFRRLLHRENAATSGFISAYATRTQERAERSTRQSAGESQALENVVDPNRKPTGGATGTGAKPLPTQLPIPPLSSSTVLQQALTDSQRAHPSHYMTRINSFRKPTNLSRRPSLPLGQQYHHHHQHQHRQEQEQEQQQMHPQTGNQRATAMALKQTRSAEPEAATTKGAARGVLSSTATTYRSFSSSSSSFASSSSTSSSIIKRAPVGGLEKKRCRQGQNHGNGKSGEWRTDKKESLDGRGTKRRQGGGGKGYVEVSEGGGRRESSSVVQKFTPTVCSGRPNFSSSSSSDKNDSTSSRMGSVDATILGTPPPSLRKKRPGGGVRGDGRGGGAVVAGTPEAVGRNVRAKRTTVAESPQG